MKTPSKSAGQPSNRRVWARAAVLVAAVAGVVFTFAPSSSAAQPSGSDEAQPDSLSATAALPLCTIDLYLGKEHGTREGVRLPAARTGGVKGNPDCVIGDGLVGCSGCSGISALQQALNDCNREDRKGIPVDGSWGPTTKEALKQAQRDLGLDDDGVYGPATRDAMEWKSLKGCTRVPRKSS